MKRSRAEMEETKEEEKLLKMDKNEFLKAFKKLRINEEVIS